MVALLPHRLLGHWVRYLGANSEPMKRFISDKRTTPGNGRFVSREKETGNPVQDRPNSACASDAAEPYGARPTIVTDPLEIYPVVGENSSVPPKMINARSEQRARSIAFRDA
jgi:hypothetical protein